MGCRGVNLLVDDEESVRLLLSTLLERNGYTVIQASDGEHAIEVANNYPEPIDVLVTDYKMPRLDGLELARRLTGQRPGLRVMIMSGRMSNPEGVHESGFPLVPKPFTISSFLESLQRCLDAPPGRR